MTTVFLLTFAVAIQAWAQQASNDPYQIEQPQLNLDSQPTGVVDVEENAYQDNRPYRDRRGPWGFLLSFAAEKYNPSDYMSLIQNKTYEQITGGTAITMGGFEMGGKYNFKLGSVALIGGYLKGSYSNSSQNIDRISVDITRIDGNFSLDNLFKEPWVVPYIQGGAHRINWSEASVNGAAIETESFTANWNFHYRAGMLFQLNWLENLIDKDSSYEGRKSSGLENAFVDIYYIHYLQPEQVASTGTEEGEADLSSSGIGAGLKLEF